MKTIKLSTPWSHDFYNQTPKKSGIIGEFKFEIDNECDKCDYWIIWGGLKKKEKVYVPSQNILYFTDEAYIEKKYNQRFLNQFPTLITCRQDIAHKNILQLHDIGIWHFKKSYEEIVDLPIPQKLHNLSVVTSDVTKLDGHKKRFALVNKLIGHFKDKLHVYGKGINPVEDKFIGLAPYKYSIAIENSSLPNYFTEKINECFLTYTMPIYFGCTNLSSYYNPNSFVPIDIADYKSCIHKIEDAVEGYYFENRIEEIKESRKKYLNEFHAFSAFTKVIANLPNFDRSTFNTIIPEIQYKKVDGVKKFIVTSFNKLMSKG